MEFDVELDLLNPKFPFGGGGGFAEFDVEFRFAKIQISHLCVCGGGGVSRNLTLSSDLLKFKIPIVWGGGVCGI